MPELCKYPPIFLLTPDFYSGRNFGQVYWGKGRLCERWYAGGSSLSGYQISLHFTNIIDHFFHVCSGYWGTLGIRNWVNCIQWSDVKADHQASANSWLAHGVPGSLGGASSSPQFMLFSPGTLWPEAALIPGWSTFPLSSSVQLRLNLTPASLQICPDNQVESQLWQCM